MNRMFVTVYAALLIYFSRHIENGERNLKFRELANLLGQVNWSWRMRCSFRLCFGEPLNMHVSSLAIFA